MLFWKLRIEIRYMFQRDKAFTALLCATIVLNYNKILYGETILGFPQSLVYSRIRHQLSKIYTIFGVKS